MRCGLATLPLCLLGTVFFGFRLFAATEAPQLDFEGRFKKVRLSVATVGNPKAVFPMFQFEERVQPSFGWGLCFLLNSWSDTGIQSSLQSLLGFSKFRFGPTLGWNFSLGGGVGKFFAANERATMEENRTLFIGMTSIGYEGEWGNTFIYGISLGLMYITPPVLELVDILYASLKPFASIGIGLQL